MKLSTSLFALLLILMSCSDNTSPKPFGHVRIDLPETHEMQPLEVDCPYEINISSIAVAEKRKENCWFNIDYPQYKSTIHLTYKPVGDQLDNLIQESRALVMKHSVKADGMQESLYINDSSKVYGSFYKLLGESANHLQFYLTDSVNHYLRGALYFNVPPNRDSLNPVIDWMEVDLQQMIESLRWKD